MDAADEEFLSKHSVATAQPGNCVLRFLCKAGDRQHSKFPNLAMRKSIAAEAQLWSPARS